MPELMPLRLYAYDKLSLAVEVQCRELPDHAIYEKRVACLCLSMPRESSIKMFIDFGGYLDYEDASGCIKVWC